MSIIQAAVRARPPASPISVVFSGAASLITENAQWSLIFPSPGSLLAGDVVLFFNSIRNGGEDFRPPLTNLLSGDFTDDGGLRNYESSVWGYRMASGGTLPQEDRQFGYFVNQVGSYGHGVMLVLRGVRESGFLTADIVNRSAAAVALTGSAALRSATRTEAKALAISFGAVSTGTLGGAPAGWEGIIQNNNPDGGSVYLESQYFPSTGTTTQVARSPEPTRRFATALVHAIAP